MFTVIDTKTGREPNLEQIALKEDWAKSLIYCDMEGFFLSEDGQLILADECGSWVYPPPDRFKVIWNNWISVEDRLPDESRRYYLCTTKDVFASGRVMREVRILSFADDLDSVDKYYFDGIHRAGWYYYDHDWGYREVGNVTHWQPLPAPPEE